MPRSRTRSHEREPTGIVVGVLLVVAIGAAVVLVGIGGGSEDREEGTKSPRVHSKTTRASTTTSTTTRPPLTYSVQRGDTVTTLARFFGVSKAALVEANPNLDADHLVVGQALVIPSPTPVQLVIKPRKVLVGGSLDLKVTGAKEFENVTFEIDRPTGPFTGPPHPSSATGVVTTTYELGLADPPGTYTVIARGDQGTVVQATFRVEAKGR